MPLFLPKRTADLDLPSLDTQTPIKSKNNEGQNVIQENIERVLPTPISRAVSSSTLKNILGTFPKRTNDLPPLEPESDSEIENNEPNLALIERISVKKLEETPKLDEKRLAQEREEDENVDQFSEMNRNQMLGPKSVLKRTFTTPCTGMKIKPAMLKGHSKSEGVSQMGSSTLGKKSATELQVVRKFAPPKNLLSARQLFTSDGREILGDSKKTVLTIKHTPTIFQNILRTNTNEIFDLSSISQNEDSCQSSVLEDTILNSDESHYSRIFDVSVAVERSVPDVDMEQFSKVMEERRPQLVDRVAELRGGMLREMCKIEKEVNNSRYNYKKPHPMSPFKEPKTPPFAVTPVQTPKMLTKSNDDSRNKKTFVTIEGKKYLICNSLGKGGSGYVFEGCAAHQDSNDSKLYAIKMVHLHHSSTIREEYLQETKILKLLENSQHIIQHFASEILRENDRDFGYIVMELGQSDLYQHLRTRKEDIPLYELGVWLNEMIHALREIHAHGIIHSDIKPANFIFVNGHLKLADFGISMCQDLDTSHIEQVVVAGTCNFLSPESVYSVVKNSPAKLSGATDIWSFGIICYYLIYKGLPFGSYLTREDKLKAIANPKTIIDFPQLPEYYPEMLRKLAMDCLQYDPTLRPTAIQLLKKYPLEKIAPIKPWSIS